MNVDLLVNAGYVLPMTERKVKENYSIAIDHGKIVDIGDRSAMDEYNADRTLDASDKIVMPGLINTHTHLAMTLFRGVNDDLSGMKWLNRAWKIESNLTAEDVYRGSKIGALEFIKTGTTCFADHYFFPEQVAKVVKETGLRAALARPIFDEGGPSDIDTGLDKGVEFTRQYSESSGGRVHTMLGPHATYSCSPALFREIGEIARREEYKVHTHLAEGREEVEKLDSQYGKRPIEYFDDAGLLNTRLLGAHVVYANKEEVSLLSERGVSVSHQPTAKMRGGEKLAPVPDMLENGVNVSVGTDGAGSKNYLDMFSEMNITALANKLKAGNPTGITAWDVLEMATIHGAKSLGLEDRIGTLSKGKRADFIVISTDGTQTTPFHNIPSLVVYGANGKNVDSVVVDGKVLMENRRTQLKEEKIKSRAQDTFESLLERSDMEVRKSEVPLEK